MTNQVINIMDADGFLAMGQEVLVTRGEEYSGWHDDQDRAVSGIRFLCDMMFRVKADAQKEGGAVWLVFLPESLSFLNKEEAERKSLLWQRSVVEQIAPKMGISVLKMEASSITQSMPGWGRLLVSIHDKHPQAEINLLCIPTTFRQFASVPYVTVKDPFKRVVHHAIKVQEKYGFPPEKLPFFLSLIGVPREGVAGIKGAGEKTATTLTQNYGCAEALWLARESLSGKISQNITEAGHRLYEDESRLNGVEAIQEKLGLPAELLSVIPAQISLGEANEAWLEKAWVKLNFHDYIEEPEPDASCAF